MRVQLFPKLHEKAYDCLLITDRSRIKSTVEKKIGGEGKKWEDKNGVLNPPHRCFSLLVATSITILALLPLKQFKISCTVV